MARMTNDLKNIDVAIGSKIYDLRISSGTSLKTLGEFLKVTHQQVQKYEKGVNRISQGRLMQIAKFFEVDLKYFHEGLEESVYQTDEQHRKQRQSLEIFKLLKSIDDEEFKRSICTFIKIFLKNQDKEV
jgi:transcriptional regulator with XRE-family HTH domain